MGSLVRMRQEVDAEYFGQKGRIRTFGSMAGTYEKAGDRKGKSYRKAQEDLGVVVAVLGGYKESLDKEQMPDDKARSALREACRAVAKDLSEINPALAGAYKTLPDRIDEGPRYRQKGESAFGAPEIIIWLIVFAIVYGILRNANIF